MSRPVQEAPDDLGRLARQRRIVRRVLGRDVLGGQPLAGTVHLKVFRLCAAIALQPDEVKALNEPFA